ncbi:MAG TPA: lactate utilization protein [Candidatus Omnitrophota bacterium]|nr:lactate utilization protein [Candidatus Omnitrophota bacterium]
MIKKDWDKLPSENAIEETARNLESRGIRVIIVNNKDEALEKLKEMIPAQAGIANGGSTTLEQIGFIDYLNKTKHNWKNLHEEVLKEKSSEKQAELRRRMVTADYFLGSINAIAKTGALVSCDTTGSRTGAYLFAAKNLILVSGINKITDNLNEAMQRVKEYVFPLENARAMKAYGRGSGLNKWMIIEREIFPNRITLILVKEKLGF